MADESKREWEGSLAAAQHDRKLLEARDGEHFRRHPLRGQDVHPSAVFSLTPYDVEALAHLEETLDRLGERLEVVEDRLDGRDPGDE